MCRSGVSCVLASWLFLASASAQAEEPVAGKERPATPPAGQGDAALRGLFGAPRASVDPELAELEALLAELADSPLAKTAGKHGLERARAELQQLHLLVAQRADEPSIARHKQLVWAALSVSDRQMARAELAAALKSALLLREREQAKLQSAKLERERSQLRLDRERQGSPPAAPEATK